MNQPFYQHIISLFISCKFFTYYHFIVYIGNPRSLLTTVCMECLLIIIVQHICPFRYKVSLRYTVYLYIMGFFKSHSANICLSIREFNLFTSKVITEKEGPTSPILISVFCMSYSFFSLSFPLLLSAFAFCWIFVTDTFNSLLNFSLYVFYRYFPWLQ